MLRAAAHEHELPIVSINSIAEVGALVGHPARANMLVSLLAYGSLTARELADAAGIAPQTASGHLDRLKLAGLIRMERDGRHHVHRLSSPRVVSLLETLHLTAIECGGSRALTAGPEHGDLRTARTCQNHLAGRMAVDLAAALVDDADQGCDRLTSDGRRRLALWGVDVDMLDSARCLCGCMDWSERRQHIAGPLGAAILSRSLALGWVQRRPTHRALTITHAGVQGFQQRFGLDLS